MRFYNRQHRHYCGIDLHVKTMYVCILDATGQTLVHRNMKSTPQAFLETIAPYRDDLVVAAECMFTWYWVADLCAAEDITFVLGHALAMKAIHGGKAKNDKIDSQKIAALLRGGLLPQAYVYPAAMRSTRDLLRRRLHLVRKRGQLLAHIQNTRAQYQLPEFGRRLAYPANRTGVSEHFSDPSVRKSIDVDLALLERYDDLITDLELTIVREAKRHDGDAFHEEQALLAASAQMGGAEHKYVGSAMHDRIIGALDTCCRRGEMLRIQNRHVDWERHQITIPGRHAKDAENRRIPFDSQGRLAPVLKRRASLGPNAYVFGSPAGEFVANFKTAWESLLLIANGHDTKRAKSCARVDRAKLRQIDLHWHDLRHEGACRLLAEHVDIRTIQRMLGHADIKPTQRYLNITDEELRKPITGVWERRRQLRAVSQ